MDGRNARWEVVEVQFIQPALSYIRVPHVTGQDSHFVGCRATAACRIPPTMPPNHSPITASCPTSQLGGATA